MLMHQLQEYLALNTSVIHFELKHLLVILVIIDLNTYFTT